MRTRTRRRARQLGFVTVAVPVAAWALEQAARGAVARGTTSPTSRRLRQVADLVQRFSRGPLADRLQRRPAMAASPADTGRAAPSQFGG